MASFIKAWNNVPGPMQRNAQALKARQKLGRAPLDGLVESAPWTFVPIAPWTSHKASSRTASNFMPLAGLATLARDHSACPGVASQSPKGACHAVAQRRREKRVRAKNARVAKVKTENMMRSRTLWSSVRWNCSGNWGRDFPRSYNEAVGMHLPG